MATSAQPRLVGAGTAGPFVGRKIASLAGSAKGDEACDDEAVAENPQASQLDCETASNEAVAEGMELEPAPAKHHLHKWELEDDLDSRSSSSSWLDNRESFEVESPDDSVSSAASVCSSVASVDEMDDYHSPEETIIIFDWDDTICPTTALNEGGLVEGCKELQDLVYEARKTLERAREVAAEVVIVTNATDGWVEATCENWLPGLRPIVDMLEFSSARSTWEPLGIDTPTGWKSAAFEQIVRKFYSRYRRQSWKNMIVIGDACYEHEALDHVASLAPQGPTKRCRAKSIRFEPQPTVEALACELRLLRECFDDIVQHDDNLEINFESESL